MMRILMMAPHPFYQERGTPIAVGLLLKSLSGAGHEVDVITFPEGEDRNYPGVTYHRVKPFTKVSGVRPGFSLKKLYLDLFVLIKFLSLMFKKRYNVVHAVEESVYFAMLVCPFFRTPYIYDMDSSMVTQLIDKAPILKKIEFILRFIESLPARFAKVVVPCCDALVKDVELFRLAKDKATIALKDISLLDKSQETPSSGINIQQHIADLSHNTPIQENGLDHKVHTQKALKYKVLMYIGNLESYQGVDLMLEGFAQACSELSDIALVVVGGEDQHIEAYQSKAKELGVSASIFFLGKQPVADLYALMKQADVLLSPRTQGVNTPMKVYSYLDSGVPVLATRLPTHTQVMSDDNTMLVEPDALSFAQGIKELINDHDLTQMLTKNAEDFVREFHSWTAFDQTVKRIYALC